MSKAEIVRRFWQEYESELQDQGYELVEVEYVQQGHSFILRVYIDKEGGGITLDDCTTVSHFLSPLLDISDFIHDNYMLEVSSPGIDRPLRKVSDFERFAGEEVRLSVHAAVGGRRKFKGVLKGIQEGVVTLECDGASWEIHLENLRKANLNR